MAGSRASAKCSVLATDKVRFQGQEVAFVVAEDHYSARDALELIDVDYEPLPVLVDPRKALDADAPIIRDDKEGRTDNHIFDWEAGDKAETDAVFARADVVVSEEVVYPRVHPAPMETCGAVADYDPVDGKLTLYETTQAPHAHRTLYAMVAGIPEHKIRILAGDIGGGFGNKVGIYPGYICAVVGSIVTGKPVKWVEDRSENLMSTSFARDYHMRGEIAATRDGRILAVRTNVLADHGAFNATAQPSRYPAGFFSVFTGSYDVEAAHCAVTGVYTNKAPGGVAYACSFRIAEAVYLVERMVDVLADELGWTRPSCGCATSSSPSISRTRTRPLGVRLRRYERAMRLALEMAGYDELRREQAEKAGPRRADGHRRRVLHRDRRRRPRKHMDIVGLAWPTAPSCGSTRPARRWSVSRADPGPGTRDDLRADRRRGDRHPARGHRGRARRHRPDPFGLGTYGSRSTPVSGGAVAMVTRKVRDKAKLIAAAMLEVRRRIWKEKAGSSSAGDPTRQDDPESRWPRTARSRCRTGWTATSAAR